ncbi:MAG: hypothetical protein PHS49_01975 [Candidatus Gracilibacteria bacterium]|nr:hypothetical protein [Candidatus Gracilibacteria bacterium]
MALSTDEKIDYIYNEIRAQKRARYFKLFFNLTIFGFMIFLYFTYINGMTKEEVTKIAGNKLGEIVAPIVKNMVDDIIKDSPGQLIDKVIK